MFKSLIRTFNKIDGKPVLLEGFVGKKGLHLTSKGRATGSIVVANCGITLNKVIEELGVKVYTKQTPENDFYYLKVISSNKIAADYMASLAPNDKIFIIGSFKADKDKNLWLNVYHCLLMEAEDVDFDVEADESIPDIDD